MYNKILLTLSEVIIQFTVHYIVHLHCNYSPSLVDIEVTVSDVLAWVRVQENNWSRLGCWNSPCFRPFSLIARLETHEVFFYVILFLYDCGKPRILIHWIWGHTYILV
jgi:hypothetical protein